MRKTYGQTWSDLQRELIYCDNDEVDESYHKYVQSLRRKVRRRERVVAAWEFGAAILKEVVYGLQYLWRVAMFPFGARLPIKCHERWWI